MIVCLKISDTFKKKRNVDGWSRKTLLVLSSFLTLQNGEDGGEVISEENRTKVDRCRPANFLAVQNSS